MKLSEFASTDLKLLSILETSGSSTTSSASIVNIPMASGPVHRRMPSEPSLFGFIPDDKPKSKKKRKKSS